MAQTPAPAQEGKKVYRTTGPGGEIIFTDQPVQGAQEVTVPPASTYQAPENLNRNLTLPDKKRANQPKYSVFVIASPKNDDVLWPEAGNVKIRVNMSPTLSSSHSMEYVMDGEVTENDETEHTYENVSRGLHTVQVRIVDKNNNIVQSTPSVSFQVHRGKAR